MHAGVAAANDVLRERAAMTPAQYRKACEQLGLSIIKSGPVLGVAPRTGQRYALGERPIPETIAKLLRAMIRLGTIEV